MKVLYLVMALMLSCIVPVQGISMQELQSSSRYEMLHGFGESGKGDGTYIDKDFKQYHIDGNRYDVQSEEQSRHMAMAPVDFGFAGYLLANQMYERIYGVQFDDALY